MRPVSLIGLTGIAVSVGAVVGTVTSMLITSGGSPLIVTPLVGVLFLVLALGLWWSGLHVRRFRAHKRTWVTPLIAMRIAVAARASADVAAGLCGALGGIALACVVRLDSHAMAQNALAAALSALAALVWTGVGVLVERWCTIDPEDEQESAGHTPTVSPA